MAIVLTLLKKDFLRLSRDRVALLLLFIVPFALITLFGQVFGINRKDSGPVGVPLAVVDSSDNVVGQKLLTALQAEPAFQVVPIQTEAQARTLLRADQYRFALVLPADLVSPGRTGLHLIFLSNPRNAIETSTVTGIVQKIVFSHAPELVAQPMGMSAGAISGQMNLLSLAKIDSEQVVGEDVKSPQATLIVGGWAMQFLLFALSNSAASIYIEKEQGIFQRLLSTPAKRSHVLWSKFLYGVLLGVIQLLVLFLAGRLMYGIDIEHHLGLLTLVCVLAAATCTAFGLLIAAFMASAEASRGVATLFILLMSAVGGAWFPVSFMPPIMQSVSKLTPVYWSMQGFQQVLWSHDSFVQLLPTVLVLAAITAGVMAVVVWRLNRSHVFE
jgi:ABC-2 type transport system permease protein